MHQKRQAVAALTAIIALALLLCIALFLATRAPANSSAKGKPADGPLAKVAKWVEPPRRPEPDFEVLIDLITTTISPSTWEEVGGGSIKEFETNISLTLPNSPVVPDEFAGETTVEPPISAR
jgi:hypothetical protein